MPAFPADMTIATPRPYWAGDETVRVSVVPAPGGYMLGAAVGSSSPWHPTRDRWFVLGMQHPLEKLLPVLCELAHWVHDGSPRAPLPGPWAPGLRAELSVRPTDEGSYALHVSVYDSPQARRVAWSVHQVWAYTEAPARVSGDLYRLAAALHRGPEVEGENGPLERLSAWPT